MNTGIVIAIRLTNCISIQLIYLLPCGPWNLTMNSFSPPRIVTSCLLSILTEVKELNKVEIVNRTSKFPLRFRSIMNFWFYNIYNLNKKENLCYYIHLISTFCRQTNQNLHNPESTFTKIIYPQVSNYWGIKNSDERFEQSENSIFLTFQHCKLY